MQIFADAITGGKVDVLFDKMQKGQVTSKELLKVAAQMRSLVDPKKLAEMMNAPSKQMERLKNSWASLIAALNKSGLWGLLSSGIDSVTKAIEGLTTQVGNIVSRFKALYDIIEMMWPFLAAGYLASKIWAIQKAAQATGVAFGVLAAESAVLMGGIAALGLIALALSDVLESIDNPSLDSYTNRWAKDDGVVGYLARGVKYATELLQKLEMLGLGSIIGDSKLEKEAQTRLGELTSPEWAAGMTTLQHGFMTPARWLYSSATGGTADEKRLMEQQQLASVMNKRMQANSPQYFRTPSELSTMKPVNREAVVFSGDIIIQNTEPNVSTEWLSGKFPDLLKQAVQREFSVVPNQSSGGY